MSRYIKWIAFTEAEDDDCDLAVMFHADRKLSSYSFNRYYVRYGDYCGGNMSKSKKWVIAQRERTPQTTPCESSGGWLDAACTLPARAKQGKRCEWQESL